MSYVNARFSKDINSTLQATRIIRSDKCEKLENQIKKKIYLLIE
jgi:hypothetical protein